MTETAPRNTVETDPLRRIMNLVSRIRTDLDALQRTSSLRNASISGGEGLQVLDDDGTPQVTIAPDRTVTVHDALGGAVVRMGEMRETGPESFGIEVRVADGSWVQLGSQSVAWENVGAKPDTYDEPSGKWDPTPHQHPGGDITSAVPNATAAVTATTAGSAAMADGSQYGWTNTVSGTEFYQVWVGNDGGFHFGRNVSSIKYKTNVRAFTADPRRVLNLRPVVYDRKPTLQPVGPGQVGPPNQYPGVKNEYGLIAEETLPHVPEVVTRFNGAVDGIRYELLPVAMIPLLQEHDREIKALQSDNAKLRQAIINMGGTI
jgi:hypothetical protein